jgi:Starch-binding associating with outer membrane/Susd and RagB outer membrane lipoprotein
MKKNKIYIVLLLISSLILGVSCESIDLNRSVDPFNLTPDKADLEFLFNGIQEDFVRQIEGDADYSTGDNWQSGGATNGDGLSLFGAELTRMYAMANGNSQDYKSVFQDSDSDDEWLNTYASLLPNIRLMTKLAEAKGDTRHIGIGQFIEAYTITAMVDFYGDIPYSEATQGAANLNPKLDTGASIYNVALALLDKAIVNFTNATSENPKVELFYNNDYAKWVKAANTLKMRLYVQTRLVDPTAIAKFNAIVASGNYISTSADDFVYSWGGTSASAPDNRHPRFGLNYTSTGGGDYMSNWFMGTMSTTADPRIRYYFYRQRSAVPGQEIAADEQALKCSLQSAPAHYIAGGFTFCNLPSGYWGRDHGDAEGVPPDGFLRTTFGVYPAGGLFDKNQYKNVSATSGAKGKGITPILLASWVDFMKAEVALSQNNISVAKTEMLNGMDKSITKVMSFGGNDPGYSSTLAQVPTPTKITNYINLISSSWDAADTNGKWNIFAVQSFIASFGNGIETYNFYRRTGYPTSLQPNRSANPGKFVRSMFYPSNAVETNSNIKQKTDQTIPVFWNTNSSPIAN